jgi:hypothetical protein
MKEEVLRMETDGTGSESCPMLGHIISDLEPSGSATYLLIMSVKLVKDWFFVYLKTDSPICYDFSF